MAETKDNPTVSVIIPTYNRAHIVGRAIQSVLNQTYQDFELIVVDDASTDNTEEVVKSFGNGRIRYIRLEKNSGTSAVPRNTAIKVARGEYIAFQDSDDEWLPEKLARQMEIFDKAPDEIGIVYTNMTRIVGDKKFNFNSPKIMPRDGIIYEKALNFAVSNIGIPSAVFRKKCFHKAGKLDERFPCWVDFEFFIRVSKYFLFHFIDEPLVNFYFTETSISTDVKAPFRARELLLEKYYKDIKKDRRLLAKYLFNIGSPLCQIGEMKRGREYLLRAVRAYPFNVKYLLGLLLSLSGNKVYTKLIEFKKIIFAYLRHDYC